MMTLAKIFVILCIAFAWCGCRVECVRSTVPRAPHLRNLAPEQREEVLAMDVEKEELARVEAMRDLLVDAARAMARLARQGPYTEQSNALAQLLVDTAAKVGRREFRLLPLRADAPRELFRACARHLHGYRRPQGYRAIRVGHATVHARDLAHTLDLLQWEEQTGLDAWEES